MGCVPLSITTSVTLFSLYIRLREIYYITASASLDIHLSSTWAFDKAIKRSPCCLCNYLALAEAEHWQARTIIHQIESSKIVHLVSNKNSYKSIYALKNTISHCHPQRTHELTMVFPPGHRSAPVRGRLVLQAYLPMNGGSQDPGQAADC